jgi:nicotinate-nucleotide adenylyltransferase
MSAPLRNSHDTHWNGLARRDLRFPFATSGQHIGLFGGSFNPPHDGHMLVAETAIKRLALDQLWWMVTPGNPLKSSSELKSLAERLALSRAMSPSPKVRVTAFEAAMPSRYSADTIALIQKRNPGVHFVWIMGADNLKHFHHWERWVDIARRIPIAVIDRPGSTLSFLSSPMALRFARARIDESDAEHLAAMNAPAWTFLHGPRSSLSSSLLRARQNAR